MKAGQTVFHPGQECPGFVRLSKGTICVSLTGPGGREVVLYRVHPGDVCLQTFSCLLDGRTYSAEGVAESDLEGEVISPTEFRDRMDSNPEFRSGVLRAVAERFAEYERLVEDVALTGFDVHLARVLLRLADGDQVHVTHEQLARETASGRAFVSRRLAHIARRGLVEPARGHLKITDPTALGQLAAGGR